MTLPNVERLRELLDYNPETGVFVRKVTSGGQVAGCVASQHDNGRGYKRIRVAGANIRVHRLAWAMHYGRYPVDEIDHINGDRSDNRICNLREATHAQNMQNRIKPRKDSISGLIGARARKDGRFASGISVNGVEHYLGYFNSAEDAHKAYVEAKRRLHEFGTI